MKKHAVLLVLAAVLAVGQANGAIVRLSPAFQSAAVNETISVDIAIDDLANMDLYGFDLDISYDPMVLMFAGYSLGTQLGVVNDVDASDMSFGDNGAGTVSLGEVSWLLDFAFQDDSFTLATLMFTAAVEGNSALMIGSLLLSDGLGESIDATVENATVTVVPEPATLLLTLAGVLLIKRKRK